MSNSSPHQNAQQLMNVERLLQLDERDVHDRMVGTVSFSLSETANLDKVTSLPTLSSKITASIDLS